MRLDPKRFRHLGLPAAAGIGLLFAVGAIVTSAKDRTQIAPRLQPPGPASGQSASIGAIGLVEAESEAVGVGAFVSGVAAQVSAEPGRRLRAGEPLFSVDARAATAEVATRQAELTEAEARLAQAHNATPGLRAQLAAAEAGVGEAEAAFAEAQDLVKMAASVKIGSTLSQREATRRRNDAAAARARLLAAHARLAQSHADLSQYATATGAEAGPALAVAAAAAEKARAALAAATTALALHTVNAPFDATVLQVNIRPGEFVQAGPLATPLVVLGRLDHLRVRAEIEESDLPRFNPKAHASASPRGAGDRRFALSPLRVDPLVVPKTALTGAAAERVDTRVLRVLYEIESDEGALYPGQQMDVFIACEPAEATESTESKTTRR